MPLGNNRSGVADRVAVRKLLDPVDVVADVEVGHPPEMFMINVSGREGEFQTLVAHLANIGVDSVVTYHA